LVKSGQRRRRYDKQYNAQQELLSKIAVLGPSRDGTIGATDGRAARGTLAAIGFAAH
jgi:hypothetical protein